MNLAPSIKTKHEAIEEQETSFSKESSDIRWDDIIFENRNKAYGAYTLRKQYDNAVIIGLGITVIIAAIILSFPSFEKYFKNESPVEKAAPKKLVYTELSAPPPIDKPKPPPPQVQLPKLQKVIKFVPPKVVREQITEEVPTIDEIKQNEVAAVEVDEVSTEGLFEEPVAEVAGDGNEIFTVVEQSPEFAGGYDAMMAFVKANMKYPANARRMSMEGTVYVGFVVSKTGQISDVTVLRGFMRECDAEAVRVVQMMPAWKPGKQNGRNVNVRFTLPLKFRLN